MSGPYLKQQLSECLFGGFLPEELPVYPVVIGNIMNPVPLNYLKHFSNHANLGASSSTTVPSKTYELAGHLSGSRVQGELAHYSLLNSKQQLSPYSKQKPETQPCNTYHAWDSELENTHVGVTSCAASRLPMLQSSEESCWIFEDEEGRKHGPHSLAELYYWHHSSYLHDSSMIFHVNNKCGPFTLAILIDECGKNGLKGMAEADTRNDDNSSFIDFISSVSEDASVQLHSVTMKAKICSSAEKKPNVTIERKKSTAMGNKVAVSFDVSKEMNSSHVTHVESPASASSSGSFGLRRKRRSSPHVSSIPVALIKKDRPELYDIQANANVTAENPPSCDMDFPPGFGRIMGSVNNCAHSPSVLESSFSGNFETMHGSLCLSPGIARAIQGSVENELYMLAKLSLFDYFEEVIKEELTKLFCSVTENKITEPNVTIERKKSTAMGNKVSVSFDVSKERNTSHVTHVESPASASSSGSFGLKRKRWSSPHVSSIPVALIEKDRPELYDIQTNANVTAENPPSCDMDFPLIFGPVMGSVDNCAHSPSVLESSFSGNFETMHGSLCLSPGTPRAIQGSVENELYMLAKLSLFEYFEDVIKVELTKLFCSGAEDKITEGTVKVVTINAENSYCEPDLSLSVDLAADIMMKSPEPSSFPTIHCGSAFERLGFSIISESDDRNFDEPLSPGPEECDTSLTLLESTKIQPSNSDDRIPMIDKDLTLAICRQKLHNEVLHEWKSSLFTCTLHKCFLSWCDLKHEPDVMKVHNKTENPTEVLQDETCRPGQENSTDSIAVIDIEKSKHSISSVLPDISVVTSKYTYFRKKRSERNKTGYFPLRMSSVDIGLRKQVWDISLEQQMPEFMIKLTESSAVDLNSQEIIKSNPEHLVNGVSSKDSEQSRLSDKSTLKRKRTRELSITHGNQNKVSSTLFCDVKVINSPYLHSNAFCNSAKDVLIDGIKCNLQEASFSRQDSNKIDKVVDGCGCDLNFLKRPDMFCHSDISKLRSQQILERKFEKEQLPSLPSKVSKHSRTSSVEKTTHRRRKVKPSKLFVPCPKSDGCARSSINGWEWRKWSQNALPSDRSRVRGISGVHFQCFGSEASASQSLNFKSSSARTNRAKLRNRLAVADGAELLKVTQMTARTKQLRFQRSKIHGWGLVALEPIEAKDFVIEYVGELIRCRVSDIREHQYEKMGIGNNYLFRLDDGYVVDATKRGGIARFINHSCEPNCCTKVITVDGQKKIFIYAKRHISAGEELTYNYRFPLEEQKIPCNCGSRRCRGSMN